MNFSQKLDDRAFRLFVQRTWERANKNMTLSPTEDKLFCLIQEHPEIDLFDREHIVDVNRIYSDEEKNPFLSLAALWEVQKQLETDTPRGIVSLVKFCFPGERSQSRIRQILSKLYLVLYFRTEGESLSDKNYLYELARMLEDSEPFNDEKKTEEEHFDYHTCNIFDQTISSLKAEIYLEASNRLMQSDMKLEHALQNCPGEWITAMASYWKRTDTNLKRDRIKQLCRFLLDEKSVEAVLSALDAEEKKAIAYLMKKNGHIRYAQFVKLFGDESNDEYWWTTHPPRSTIGRLRYKGLVYVGRIENKYKIAFIPSDLVKLLATGFRL